MGEVTYERPPLTEVTFGLRFAPLSGLRAAHFGAYWAKIRAQFPETLDKPPVGIPEIGKPDEWLPLPRVWFVHKNQELLLQLQRDRFYFNWRRSGEGSAYPRFSVLAPQFEEYVRALAAFIGEESIGPLSVQGFELTYTNHIFKGEGWNSVDNIGMLFPDLAWRGHSRPQGKLKGFAWHAAFSHPEISVEADIKFGITRDNPPRELVALEIQTSMTRDSMKLDELKSSLEKANSLIVSTFEDLTDDKAKKEVWKRVSA